MTIDRDAANARRRAAARLRADADWCAYYLDGGEAEYHSHLLASLPSEAVGQTVFVYNEPHNYPRRPPRRAKKPPSE